MLQTPCDAKRERKSFERKGKKRKGGKREEENQHDASLTLL
jgi:hypothetical protein